MKIFTFSFKSLLIAAGLMLGSANAWADVELTETYNFASFITANGAGNLTTSGDGIAQSGTSTKVGTVKVINNLTANAQTLDLKGRFAVDYQYNAGSQIRFMWRSSANNYQHGLAGNWNSKGSADPQGAARFSVLNLKAGDKITFTYYKQAGKAADPYTCSASQLTGIAVDAALASGTEYTVAADGNVDLYFKDNNFAIASIVIKTTGTENVSTPSINVTGASSKARKVTITAGASDAGNDVTTYYTIDGSTPTTLSASFTTASKEITVGEGATEEATVTVKAFSVSSSTAESAVASRDVSVGTLVQLAAPSISLSSFASGGRFEYNPVYSFTSDQSGVLGNPSVTYSYSFAGGASTAGSSYTAPASGSITVTVSADGYESNSTVQSIVGGSYAKTYSFDAINDVTVDTSTGTWENQTNVGGVQWTFTDLTNCTYTLRADISLTNFRYARATTAQTKQGFYVRAGNGSVGFTLTDGEYIVFGMLGGTNTIVNSEATSKSFGQYSNVRSIEIFTPATEVDFAILDCKQYETSAAFATAVDAESFSTAAEVYAFHTIWQIENAGSNDITKVIRNANIADETDWDGAIIRSGEKYTGAPDEYYLDQYQATINSSQTIYGVPAGKYTIKAATRANAGLVNGWLYVNDGTSDIAKVDINRDGNTGGTLGNGWSWSEMTFVITETKDLLIGFYANASASTMWAGCDTWKMTLVATPKTPQSSANLDGWKTFYNADSNYKVDENTTIYIATTPASSATSVVLTPVSGKVVPANTPVILKTEAGDWKMNLTPTSSNPVDASEFTANGLQVATASGVIDGARILAYTTADGLGFYPFSGSLDAGDVYITVSGPAKKLSLVVGGEASEVVAPEVAETEEEEVLFNMAGIQVDKNFKGFVVNQKGEKRFNR